MGVLRSHREESDATRRGAEVARHASHGPGRQAYEERRARASVRERGSHDPLVGVAAAVLVGWLLVSHAVLFDELLGILSPEVDATARLEPETAIEMLRSSLGEDDVPKSPEFESRLARHIEIYERLPDVRVALERREELLPQIAPILEEHHVHGIFTFLPVVESFYEPRAWNRRTDARGMWQLRPQTAREYGLVITRNRDDRLDPIAATRAAARYLQDLLGVFGAESVSLVAAAYNAGDSTVRYALRQIDDPGTERTYWHLVEQTLLPVETRQYVFRLFAAAALAD